MHRIKFAWKRLPDKPRRTLTLIIGVLLIVLSGLVGWLPGPGGMVIFLLGVAVLASEFTWAERVRDYILKILGQVATLIKKHPVPSLIIISVMIACAIALSVAFYTYVL